jgi:hypothetical protein
VPAQYEKIKASYMAAGKPKSLAEKLAAMTYNAHRKPGMAPVTRNSDSLQARLTKKK